MRQLCQGCSIDADGNTQCDEDSECFWCNSHREERCKGCGKAITEEDKEYEKSLDFCDTEGENCIDCVNDFIKQLEENEKEND
tara:strand:- start:4 stop:252 length:249 start_codon:yes stop_codon:yes gene_type:complete